MLASRFALFTALALLTTAPRAHAEAGDRATAEALFQAGREDFVRGDFAAACAKFEESQRLEPTAGTALNLAVCSEKLGKIATAWRYYREAVEKLPDNRRGLAEERMKAIEPTVPHLTVGLERGVSPDARIERNGVEMGRVTLGVALPVDPGKHVIVVKAPGHADRAFEVEIAAGESKDLVVTSGDALPDSPAASTTEAPVASSQAPDADAGSGSSGLRTAGFIVGGIGLAGLATMGVTGVLAMGKQGTVEEHCDGQQCDPEGLDAASSGKTFSTIANVSLAVGLAGVGAGIVLILVGGGGENETSLRAEATPAGGVMRLRGTF